MIQNLFIDFVPLITYIIFQHEVINAAANWLQSAVQVTKVVLFTKVAKIQRCARDVNIMHHDSAIPHLIPICSRSEIG